MMDKNDPKFKRCCDIIDRLEDYETYIMGDLLVTLSLNFPEVCEYILNNYEEEILGKEE